MLPLDARLLQEMEIAAYQMLVWLCAATYISAINLRAKGRLVRENWPTPSLPAQGCRKGPQIRGTLWLLKWKVNPICAQCSKDGARACTQRLLRPARCPFPKVSMFLLHCSIHHQTLKPSCPGPACKPLAWQWRPVIPATRYCSPSRGRIVKGPTRCDVVLEGHTHRLLRPVYHLSSASLVGV